MVEHGNRKSELFLEEIGKIRSDLMKAVTVKDVVFALRRVSWHLFYC